MSEGNDSKRDSRVFLLLGAVIGLPFLWTWHQDAVMKARATGRSDVWALICEKHPELAERLFDYDDINPSDPNGPPARCKDFEHHFDKD